MELSRRAAASRINGRLGGLKTAQTHSPEFLEARATKAGNATRDMYGLEYYKYISKFKGPQSTKARIEKVNQEISPELISISEPTSAQVMQAATKTLKV